MYSGIALLKWLTGTHFSVVSLFECDHTPNYAASGKYCKSPAKLATKKTDLCMMIKEDERANLIIKKEESFSLWATVSLSHS